MDISSLTICSFPLTLFFMMILMATLPFGPSASRTMPYVPAPRVRPKWYLDLEYRVRMVSCGSTVTCAKDRTFSHSFQADRPDDESCSKLENVKLAQLS